MGASEDRYGNVRIRDISIPIPIPNLNFTYVNILNFNFDNIIIGPFKVDIEGRIILFVSSLEAWRVRFRASVAS